MKTPKKFRNIKAWSNMVHTNTSLLESLKEGNIEQQLGILWTRVDQLDQSPGGRGGKISGGFSKKTASGNSKADPGGSLSDRETKKAG